MTRSIWSVVASLAVMLVGWAQLQAHYPTSIGTLTVWAAAWLVLMGAGLHYWQRTPHVNPRLLVGVTIVSAFALGVLAWQAADVERTVDEPVSVGGGRVEVLASSLLVGDRNDSIAQVRLTRQGDAYAIVLLDADIAPAPDLRVWLVDPDEDDTRVDLGSLRGTEGRQRYAIPGSVNLSTHRRVEVTSEGFAVRWASADLFTQRLLPDHALGAPAPDGER